MTEYFCQEHQTNFFKTPKMKGYAHPIEGTEPTEWCNRPEDLPPPDASTKAFKPAQAKEFKADPAKTDSIEVQVAFKGVVELVVAKALDINSELADAALRWAGGRLDTPPRVDVTPEKGKLPEKLTTPMSEEQKGILKGYKDAKVPLSDYLNTLNLHPTAISKMSMAEADLLINFVKGQQEPEDLPF